MKNLIYVVAVMAVLGIASCGKKGEAVVVSELGDTVEVVTDTLTDGAVDTVAVDTMTVLEEVVE